MTETYGRQQPNRLANTLQSRLSRFDVNCLIDNLNDQLSIQKLLIEKLDLSDCERTVGVIAIGKTSVSMTRAFFMHSGCSVSSGLVIYPSGVKFDSISDKLLYLGADHPIPRRGSFKAGELVLKYVNENQSESFVVLLSGGSSALVAVPASGISKRDKIQAHRALVYSGLDIGSINTVRRHISAIKGGRLLEILVKRKKKIQVYAISDVHGDFPHDIGSGLFSPDPTSYDQALAIAKNVSGFPLSVIKFLQNGAKGLYPETFKPSSKIGNLYKFEIVANQETAKKAASSAIQKMGYSNIVIGPTLIGSPEKWLEGFVNDFLLPDRLGKWVICTGETEVAMPAKTKVGRGGRVSHLILTAGVKFFELGFDFELVGIATDGVDGNSDTSGCFLFAQDLNYENYGRAKKALAEFDSATFLKTKMLTFPPKPGGVNLGDIFLCHVFIG